MDVIRSQINVFLIAQNVFVYVVPLRQTWSRWRSGGGNGWRIMIILIQIKRITHGAGSVPTAKARGEEDGRDGFYWILVKHTLGGTAGQEHPPPIPRTGCRISSPLTFPARHLLYPINTMRAPGKTIGHPPSHPFRPPFGWCGPRVSLYSSRYNNGPFFFYKMTVYGPWSVQDNVIAS